MSYLKRTIFLLIGSLLMSCAAWAQINRGSITGIVTDQSGAVIANASVSVTNQGTGVTAHITTNSSGVYSFSFLDPASYKLVVVADGFKQYSRAGIVVAVGETIRADVQLAVGSKTEVVEVTAKAPELERESSDTGTTITAREEEDLPLTSFGDQRTPATFMQLAPGVTGQGNSDGGPGGGRLYTTSVAGGAVSSTTMSLDGGDIPTADGFEGDLRALQIPPDAIQEFKLESTNESAEYGRSEGGSANYEMKSGTNQIHGTAYEYVRNTALNAVPWFTNFNPGGCESNGTTPIAAGYTGATKACDPEYKQNEFGITAGGPIKKDKIFAFGYYDGYRLIQAGSSALQTVPTAQMLQGNFQDYGVGNPNGPSAGAWTQIPIVDPSLPANGRATAPTGGAQFPTATCGPEVCNNIINPLYFDRVSKLVNPFFPAPTITNPYTVANNYGSTTPNPFSVNEYGFKGDYVLNDKNRLSGLYSYGKQTTPNIPLIPAPLGGGDQPSDNITRNIRLNWNWTPRSDMSNQATLGVNQWNSGQPEVTPWAGKADWTSYFGIGGVSPNYPTEFPNIQIGGTDYVGGGTPSVTDLHTTIFNDSLTWVKGKHTLKFGFQMTKGAQNSISPGGSAGRFNFGNLETAAPGYTTTGAPFASYLLGVTDSATDYHFLVPGYARDSSYAAFAQDDFKVTRKLTLNLGVRWDLFMPETQRYNQKTWIDYSQPNPAANNIPGILNHATPGNETGLNTYYKQFSPRIGLAYSVDSKTVIRAAYGIYYAQGNALGLSGGTFNEGYNGTVNVSTPNNGITPAFVWGTGTLPSFSPSIAPTSFIGAGSAQASYSSLIALDKTDSLAPYAQNYTFDVERQLPGQMVLSVAFVGNKGTHTASRLMNNDKMPLQYLPLGNMVGSDGTTSLLNSPISDPVAQANAPAKFVVDPTTGNKVPFAGFEAAFQRGSAANEPSLGQALRTAPQYTGTSRYYEALGVSDYDALQVKLTKRFSNGLSLLVSYAWSKTLTDSGSMFSTFSSDFGTTDPWNRRTQKSYSFEDLPNLASIAYVYDLPIGKGKAFLNRGGVANAILGGWKTSGILRYQSGFPQEIEGNGTTSTLEDNGWQPANRINGVPMASAAYLSGQGHFDPGKGDSMFNAGAFAQPANWTFGTITPNEATVRNFPWPNEDLSLMKDWTLHESWTLTFNADFFNVFNRHVFDNNNGAYTDEWTVGQPGFGTDYGTAGNPRVIQFGMKLKW
jgi:hypothetical protein